MARRENGNMNGERYLGNRNMMELHDLDNEATGADGCEIDAIISAGNDIPYNSLSDAYMNGFDNCNKCIKG